ncbi:MULTISPECIES: hypothetical protein [unclassified Microbacterium]|uniref:hypothetical protein n=1 Tax=unclassified Microbacterium TaxID=2609290 RepID=UPI00214CAEEA|nr:MULTISPECIES: hypothetical protein [unclassified Microbacterium]MCR2809699.1 hypothetical protein [Microbacterium sp. zg.B185]WIM17983.1 hypothetical protein QNO12_10195 [Microbacterium sp. zg-B185]
MKRTATVWIAAGAAVLLVIAGALAWWSLSRPPSAEDAARSYLTALAGGDFATIDAMRGNDVDEDAERVLMDSFAGADAYASETRVEEITTGADATTVRASAVIAGERREVSFALRDDGGRWELTGDYLASLEVTVVSAAGTPLGDSAWVGGALAPTARPILLLPAEYPVRPAPRGLLTGEASVALSTDEPAAVRINASIAPDATAAGQAQLNAYADACTQPASAVPPDCGLRVPWAADLATLESIAFRIEQLPVLAFAPDQRTFAATGGVVVATATGLTSDGGATSFTYRADDWSLRGTVTFRGDEMVLALD